MSYQFSILEERRELKPSDERDKGYEKKEVDEEEKDVEEVTLSCFLLPLLCLPFLRFMREE